MRLASSVVADSPNGGKPLVVKIGGSLAETGRLASILAFVESARVPVVVVPGGGPFADSVRALQSTMNFDDAVAHRLAMLAMHQMAEFIVAQHARLKVAQTLTDISGILKEREVPVWAPLRSIAGDATIPADWSATSDSLAARLAELLGGARLVLLKSVDVDKNADCEEMARRGVVDPVFPSIVARGRLSWSIFGPSDDAQFRAVLEGGGGN
jgi:aspartokinase-like uncharacterized kinase